LYAYHGENGFGMDRFDMEACFIWRVRDGLVVDTTDFLSPPLKPRASRESVMTKSIDLEQTTAERRQRGDEIVNHLTNGAPRPASLDALERDFPFLSNAVSAFAVGELFDRTDVLDIRTRQLALCAAFAVLGLTHYIKIHAGYALNHGATEEEVKEIANLTIIPGGGPTRRHGLAGDLRTLGGAKALTGIGTRVPRSRSNRATDAAHLACYNRDLAFNLTDNRAFCPSVSHLS
jgi:4-carboxymuconolactone decarboxylase